MRSYAGRDGGIARIQQDDNILSSAQNSTQANQEPQTENPFQVIPGNSVKQLSTLPPAKSENGDEGEVDMNIGPAGINDQLIIREALPSGGAGLPALDSNTTDEGETATVAQPEKDSSANKSENDLLDIHWGIWLAIAVPAVVLFSWSSRRVMRWQRRAFRPRTKEDTLPPITNRLRDVDDAEATAVESEETTAQVAKQRSHSKTKKSEADTKSYGEIARANAQMALATVGNGSELGANDSYPLSADGASDLDPSRYKNLLLHQADDLFDGEAKETRLGAAGHSRAEIEELLAAHVNTLNARIEKLEAEHQHVSSAKSSPENRSQLKAIQEELMRWQETANSLRAQLNSLTQHASQSDQRVSELEEVNKQLNDELAADRTALIALNQLLEAKEMEIQKLLENKQT